MYKSLLNAIVLIAMATAAEAQTRFTLQDAVAAALDPARSLQIQEAQEAERQMQAQAAEARALLLPTFSVGATELNQARNLGAEGFRFPTGVPGFKIPSRVGPFSTFDARVSAQQNVLNFAALRRERTFRSQLQAQHWATEQQREQIAVDVARAYFAVLRGRIAVEAARTDRELEQVKLAALEQRKTADRAIPVELISAHSALANIAVNVSAEEGIYKEAKIKLAYLCNLDLSFDFEAVVEASWGTSSAVNGEQTPEVRRAASIAEASKAVEQAIRLEHLPSVSAFGDAGILGGVETHTVGISVTLPLWDGGRRDARRQAAISALRQDELRVRQLVRQAALDRARAEVEYDAAVQQHALAGEISNAADQELGHVERLVNAGISNRTDLFAAQNRRAHARADEALATIRIGEAELARAIANGGVIAWTEKNPDSARARVPSETR